MTKRAARLAFRPDLASSTTVKRRRGDRDTGATAPAKNRAHERFIDTSVSLRRRQSASSSIFSRVEPLQETTDAKEIRLRSLLLTIRF